MQSHIQKTGYADDVAVIAGREKELKDMRKR